MLLVAYRCAYLPQILLVRSLHSYVRVLPAYRMYRASQRAGADMYGLRYTLSSNTDPVTSAQHQPGAAAASHQRMCAFSFCPVATGGDSMFSISVEYAPASAVHCLEVCEAVCLLCVVCAFSPAVYGLG